MSFSQDLNGSSDPVVEVCALGQKRTTKVHHNCTTCMFDEVRHPCTQCVREHILLQTAHGGQCVV
jgi:hypothetical protein